MTSLEKRELYHLTRRAVRNGVMSGAFYSALAAAFLYCLFWIVVSMVVAL